MAKSKVFTGSADEIETAFYEALRLGDIERLMACWADEDDVVCVHPGGECLIGVAAIRGAFESMFSHQTVQAQPVRVRRVESMSCSMHNVIERITVLTADGPREAWVVATNVYLRTAQGWRMVAHHASPATQRDAQDAGDSRPVLH